MVRLRSRFVVTSSEIIASHNGVSQQESIVTVICSMELLDL